MNKLKEKFIQFIKEYAGEYKEAYRSGNYSCPWKGLVTREIPEVLRTNIKESVYKVEGSVGKGKWTPTPWIAIMNKAITESTTEGVYIVYILNKDTEELFLTLNQGATGLMEKIKDGLGLKGTNNNPVNDATKKKLSADAGFIREKINNPDDLWVEKGINTGNEVYDAGCIYFKKYTLSNLADMKDDEELKADLKKFMDLYQSYVDHQDEIDKGMPFNSGTSHKITFGTESETSMSEEKKSLKDIKNFISQKGFKYAEGQIENFYLCLKTKPFVLLAGTSGTGKTKLVRLFAEAIGAFKPGESADKQRYLQVPVKPDWTDSTDLFGHLDLNNNFVPGAIINFIERASNDRDKPYILCMDEMNLARVEYYLSDFLSVIETRDWSKYSENEDKNKKKIITDPLVPKVCYSGVKEKTIEDRYKELQLPDNLYLVGTVNMDETTFPFSKKVLDRANTIEFSNIDLEVPDFEGLEGQNQNITTNTEDKGNEGLPNDFLCAEYLVLERDCRKTKNEWDKVKDYNKKIETIYNILEDEHFGYRIRDEIIFYMLYNNRFNLMNEDAAFDYQIMQKVLPRIQGESRTIETILKKLFIYSCAGELPVGELDVNSMYDAQKNNYKEVIKKAKEETKTSKSYEEALREAGIKYSLSAAKIDKMLRRYEEDGFTTFWT